MTWLTSVFLDGIVGHTATATDKAGRSVPAPGKGVLSTARQVPSIKESLLLNIDYRKRQLEFRRKQISEVRLFMNLFFFFPVDIAFAVAGQRD